MIKINRIIELKNKKPFKELLQKKSLILRVHTRPDSDIFLAVAYLKMHGANIKQVIFEIGGGIENGIKFRKNKGNEVIHIDIFHKEFDHHGKSNKTSLHMTVEELGNEEWLKPVLSRLLRIDSYGESLFADIGSIGKALVHDKLSDKKILEIGSEAARLILEFHKHGLKRNHKLTQRIIRKFFINKQIPKTFKKYIKCLDNERFERSCDLCEIVTAKSVEKEEEAEKFALELISYLYKDYREYQKGRKEAKKAVRIRIKGTKNFVSAIEKCTSPKSKTVLIGQGAISVIQKGQGNIQIFFDNKRVNKETTDLIIFRLRKIERILKGETSHLFWDILTRPETIPGCPEWYYFLGEVKRNEKRGIFIFNGSLTAPDVPPTKILFDGVVSIVVLTLEEIGQQYKKRFQ